MSATKEVVLCLGAGEKPMAGATNVDFRPLPGIDVVSDAAKLPFPADHADKVVASDLLEHFPRAQVPSVLIEWKRVVKPGGTVILKTPNLRTICERYLRGEFPAEEAARLLYGGQNYPGNFHNAGFDPALLTALCKAAGFRVVRVLEHPDPPDQNNMIVRVTKP